MMEDEKRYGAISPTPRNPYVGMAADAAGGIRDFGNAVGRKVLAPVAQYATRYAPPNIRDTAANASGQLGTLLAGAAPEELDRWAHGDSPFMQKPPSYAGLRGIPELQSKRIGPVVDTMFLGADAAGVGMGLRALGKAGGKQTVKAFNNVTSDAQQDPSRRTFIKNAGVLGAGAAAAAATPKLFKAAAKALAPNPTTAATRVAKNAVGSVSEYYAAMRKARETFSDTFRSHQLDLQDADPEFARLATQKDEAFARLKSEYELANPHGAAFEDIDIPDEGFTPEWWAFDKKRDEIEDIAFDHARKAERAAMDDLMKANPDYADLRFDVDSYYDMDKGAYDPAFLERTGVLPNNTAVYERLKNGGAYTDPTTGNRAKLRDGYDPSLGDTYWVTPDGTKIPIPKTGPGAINTAEDADRVRKGWNRITNGKGSVEWESPNGAVSPYQHWLPRYVPDEDIGKFLPDGRVKKTAHLKLPLPF